MLRACPSRDEQIVQFNEHESIILYSDSEPVTMGLRRCPSVENLREISMIEAVRLEEEASILI